MKIAFFGTPDFAGKILSGILEYSEIDCRLVVSQPDKAVGRKKELMPTYVKQVALKNNIEVLQPEKIRKNIEFFDRLRDLGLDFIVVVAYGKIIPKEILEIPKLGCVNIHGSILPKYRGASPVQAAVKDGQTETGLTIMYMSEGMDEGDVLEIAKVNIDNVDTSEDMFRKFIEIGPELLLNTLKKVQSGEIRGIPQEVSQVTYCSKIEREDGEVFFQQQTAQEIYNTYRAYTPWPGIFTFFEGKRFVVEECCFEDIGEFEKNYPEDVSPGEFIKINKKTFGIICSDKKFLILKKVKLEGKKPMDIASFVNGSKDLVGYVFK